ncbi:MAG TPA: L,D-transpeptidase family protein [Sedimentisphaerales bacterium]|nr:L,D-transpeptidase family protein [Sedimentisphaerales bacterium]
MALYTPNAYGKRKNRTRNWIYIISGLLVVGVVIAFKYGNHPFGRSRPEDPAPKTDVPAAKETVPAPEPVPAGPAQPAPEPVPQPQPAPQPKPESDPANAATEPIVRANPEVTNIINGALALINENPSKIIEARTVFNDALLRMSMSQEQRDFIKKQLSWLADKWLFSRSVFPEDRLCGAYKVEPGDYLQTIGKQLKVPHEILQEINNIARPEALQAGQTIKVINGPFNAKVHRSTFTMDLYLQNTFVRSFTVGLGKPGRETPTGLYCVDPAGKLIRPSWTDPDTGKQYRPDDPDYPLGSRWIGLKGLEGDANGRTGLAFHGTKDSDLMAGGGSRGCIRLHNGDAVLVYSLLTPTYSQVEVLE